MDFTDMKTHIREDSYEEIHNELDKFDPAPPRSINKDGEPATDELFQWLLGVAARLRWMRGERVKPRFPCT